MRILITGSLGHIASRVVPLLPREYDLVLTDIREGSIAGKPVTSLDITDYQAVLSATKSVDAILHLAITSSSQVVTDEALFETNQGNEYLKFNELSIETNIRGTYHLFEAARQNQISRVVYGSSLTVLIGAPRYETICDDLSPRPSNFYGVTKLWGEQLGEYFSRIHGLRIYCLRFGTPHPWKEHHKFMQWVKSSPPRRTFVTYGDLAGAIQAALEAGGPRFGAYTIVSSGADSIYDVSKGAEIGWAPKDFVEIDGTVRPIAAVELTPA